MDTVSLRVGLDIDQMAHESRSGLYYYCSHLAKALCCLKTSHKVSLFTSRALGPGRMAELEREYSPLNPTLFKHPGWPYRLRMAFNPVSRLDAFFYLTSTAIPIMESRINAFLIPDLTTLHFPQCHTEATRRHWARYFDTVKRHGDVVVTFSEHTRHDVADTLGLPLDRLRAVPLAAARQFRPLDRAEVAVGLKTIGLEPERYILSVGTLEPRKNHLVLLQAYHRLVNRGEHNGQPLVLAGPKGWNYEPIFEEIERLGLASQVRHLGHFPRLDLLMNGASVMVYPSIFEGFGLPPLEAMACGTPVITSNASSLPEVVGDAGVMIDPHDVDGFAQAIAQVLNDQKKRTEMRDAGLKRAQQFSWEKTARLTLDALTNAVDARRQGRKRCG